jgi:hypothetical protein
MLWREHAWSALWTTWSGQNGRLAVAKTISFSLRLLFVEAAAIVIASQVASLGRPTMYLLNAAASIVSVFVDSIYSNLVSSLLALACATAVILVGEFDAHGSDQFHEQWMVFCAASLLQDLLLNQPLRVLVRHLVEIAATRRNHAAVMHEMKMKCLDSQAHRVSPSASAGCACSIFGSAAQVAAEAPDRLDRMIRGGVAAAVGDNGESSVPLRIVLEWPFSSAASPTRLGSSLLSVGHQLVRELGEIMPSQFALVSVFPLSPGATVLRMRAPHAFRPADSAAAASTSLPRSCTVESSLVVIELETRHGCEPGTDLDDIVAQLSVLVNDNLLHARRLGFVRRSQPLQSFLCRRIVRVDSLASHCSAKEAEGDDSPINAHELRIDVGTFEQGIESKTDAVRRFFYSKAVQDEMAYLDASVKAASTPSYSLQDEKSADAAPQHVGLPANCAYRHGRSLTFGTIGEGPLKGLSFHLPGAIASSSKYCHVQVDGRRSPSSARPPLAHFPSHTNCDDDA